MAPGRFKKTRGFSLEKVGSILNGIVNAAPVLSNTISTLFPGSKAANISQGIAGGLGTAKNVYNQVKQAYKTGYNAGPAIQATNSAA